MNNMGDLPGDVFELAAMRLYVPPIYVFTRATGDPSGLAAQR
jgi:hypothetical protein